jgi:hypothetical protein
MVVIFLGGDGAGGWILSRVRPHGVRSELCFASKRKMSQLLPTQIFPSRSYARVVRRKPALAVGLYRVVTCPNDTLFHRISREPTILIIDITDHIVLI